MSNKVTVDWYDKGERDSGEECEKDSLIKILDCQAFGDEPLYSMFDRTYNQNEMYINDNDNFKGKENNFDLIINRGVINKLQSQLSQLYNTVSQYICQTKFESLKTDNNTTSISINTCYQMYEKKNNDIYNRFIASLNNTAALKKQIEEMRKNFKEKMKDRSETIPPSLAISTQYLSLALVKIEDMNDEDLMGIIRSVDYFLPQLFNDESEKFKYNEALSCAVQPLFQFLSKVMLIPAKKPARAALAIDQENKVNLDQEASTEWVPFTQDDCLGVLRFKVPYCVCLCLRLRFIFCFLFLFLSCVFSFGRLCYN